MNMKALREQMYRWVGKNDSGQRQDYFLQEVDDAINETINRIKKSTHWWWYDVRESSISIVAGTKVYALSDFCLLPIGFWTVDTGAHEVELVDLKEMDWSGLRSTDVLEGDLGPFKYNWTQRRHTSSKTGYCNITEATKAVTWVSGDAFASSDVDKRIRFEGSEVDYKVATFVTPNITIDRYYRGILRGTGTSGLSGNLSSGKFEISPAPVWQLEFNPTPSAAATLKYRYVHRWTRLLYDDDTPGLDDQWHFAILLGAKSMLAAYCKEPESGDRYEGLFQSAVKRMNEVDNKPSGAPGRMMYRSMSRMAVGRGRAWPKDRDTGRY